MKRIGVFGGTFNPIHLGHLIAAQEVLYKMKLDKIVFMPSGDPPHKSNYFLASSSDRLEMVWLAIEGNKSFTVSDMEIKRIGKTYTYDTLIELHKIYYGDKFYFIVGFDALKEMHTWKNAEELFKLTDLIVVNRGILEEGMKDEIKDKEKCGASINLVEIPDIGISSTDIRKRIFIGEGIRYLVPDNVFEYITKKGLYVDDNRGSI